MSGVLVVGGKNRIVLHLTYSDQTPIHSRKNEKKFQQTVLPHPSRQIREDRYIEKSRSEMTFVQSPKTVFCPGR
jgi:hypothetical protein